MRTKRSIDPQALPFGPKDVKYRSLAGQNPASRTKSLARKYAPEGPVPPLRRASHPEIGAATQDQPANGILQCVAARGALKTPGSGNLSPT